MAHKTYNEKLQHPAWQKKRLEVLNRDNFTCTLCGDKESTLHIHHSKYCGNPWEVDNYYLTTLCKHCHSVKEHFKTDEAINVLKVVKVFSSSGDLIIQTYLLLYGEVGVAVALGNYINNSYSHVLIIRQCALHTMMENIQLIEKPTPACQIEF